MEEKIPVDSNIISFGMRTIFKNFFLGTAFIVIFLLNLMIQMKTLFLTEVKIYG